MLFRTPGPAPLRGPDTDAFGNMRVTSPLLLLEDKNVVASANVGNLAAGGASISQPAGRSSFYLTTGGAGSKATRQTRQRAPYQPGKSQKINMTFTAGTQATGIVQRIGYFDDNNGLFFEINGSDLFCVIRSNVSGSVVDTKIARADWINENGDHEPLDGTGPSGVTLDLTKSQILQIDFQWLGVGAVRWGFVIDGRCITCHVNLRANRGAGVYMRAPNQPLRWQIEAVGVATVSTLEAICGAVNSEGGYESRGLNLAFDNDGVGKAINGAGYSELLAVRLNANGLLFGTGQPLNMTVLCSTTASFLAELWLNATGMSAGTWASPTGSLIEASYDRTGNYTGGVKIKSFYSSAQANIITQEIPPLVGLGFDINTSLADVFSLRVYNISGNNTFYGSLNMRQEA